MNCRRESDIDFADAVARLESFLLNSSARKIAIYGMGRHSRDIMESVNLKQCLKQHIFIGWFCDNPVASKYFFGYPCVSKRHALVNADCIILSSDAYERQMRANLDACNCQAFIFEMYAQKNQLNYDTAHNTEILGLNNATTFTLRFDRVLPKFSMQIQTLQTASVLSATRKDAEEWMHLHADIPLAQLLYDGLNLFEISKGTIACHINNANINTRRDKVIIKEQVTDTVAYLMGFDDIFSRPDKNIRVLLILNGFWNDAWAAALMARRYGIQVVATELSFFPGLVYVEHITGRVANDTMLAAYSDVYLRERVTNPKQSRLVRRFFSARKPEDEKRADRFGQPQGEDISEIKARLRIPDDKRVAIAIMQVASDTTIVYDNPLYKDNIEFIEDLLPWFKAHPEWMLVIKPHPKEFAGFAARGKTPLANITYRKLNNFLKAVTFQNIILTKADETNIYSLFNIADFAVTINSQSGLEFPAQTRRRTLVFGKAAYGGKGFTLDITNRAFVTTALETAAARPELNINENKQLEKFLYHMLYEYLYPVSIENDPARLNRLIRLFQGDSSFLSPNSNINQLALD